MQRQGILFVISAPSGAGKSTICRGLRQTPDFVFSVSCTTRRPRPGEVDGESYWFISEEDFSQRVANGEFLEWAEVHGHRYGTLKAKVMELLSQGMDVLLDIDVAGADQVRAQQEHCIQEALVDVFVMPPSHEELERRLRQRGTEDEQQIQVRLKNAMGEMQAWNRYKYVIVSASMEDDLNRFRAIMNAERCLVKRLR